MPYKVKALVRLILDTLIVFICLIGAAEIRSFGCEIDDGEYEEALQRFDQTIEERQIELADAYERSKTTIQAPPETSLFSCAQRKSFFEAIQGIPDQSFIVLYYSVAVVLAADGLLSMRMAGYLHDTSLLSAGAFEFMSGAGLLAIPFLVFQLKNYR